MITPIKALMTIGLMVLIVAALTSPLRARDVFNDCAADIKTYCNKVTPGNGRLLACMYAHEDKISDKCDVAIADAADQLDWFFARLRQAIADCAADIQKHCANVKAGQGRIFVCLKLKQAELTDRCKPVVARISERLTAE